jgi:hypothetical protein
MYVHDDEQYSVFLSQNGVPTGQVVSHLLTVALYVASMNEAFGEAHSVFIQHGCKIPETFMTE